MAKRNINQFVTLTASSKTVEKWDNEVHKAASKSARLLPKARKVRGEHNVHH